VRALLVAVLFSGAAGAEPVPVLVELFTSEGCSSCPAAEEALAGLVRQQPVPGVEIVPLELHVDYWNSLGWADPFSSPEATERQERYAESASVQGYAAGLYTPQMVVDGTRSFVGNRALALEAVERAAPQPKREVHVEPRPAPGGLDVQVRVSPGDGPATVYVALTESGLSSQVTRGENRGRTLAHAPVARTLERAASVPASGWTGQIRVVLARSWRREKLRLVAFVQDQGSRRVVGIGTAAVPPSGDVAPSASLH